MNGETCHYSREGFKHGKHVLEFQYEDLTTNGRYKVRLDLDHLAALCAQADRNKSSVCKRGPLQVRRSRW